MAQVAERVLTASTPIQSPTFHSSGVMYLVSCALRPPESACIYTVVSENGVTKLAKHGDSLGVVTNALAFDADGQAFVADSGYNALLTVPPEGGDFAEFVKEYEGKPFKGPNSIAIDSRGSIYFTDSGPLGETTLQRPRGSVFVVVAEGQILQPICYESLAHPSGIALSRNQQTLFVAETLQNRVLRLAQRPAGVFHASVFHQFSGGLGPTAVAVDPVRGDVCVARCDFASEEGARGVVSVLSAEGAHKYDIAVPGPEVTGLCFDPASPETLYITEASTRSLYRATLQ
eukprot:tig00000158_g10179.t1